MPITINNKTLNNFYTEYIIDFFLEVSLFVSGWIALIIGSFSVEIANVLTQSVTYIQPVINSQEITLSFDSWLERISKIASILLPLASFIIVLLRKKKSRDKK